MTAVPVARPDGRGASAPASADPARVGGAVVSTGTGAGGDVPTGALDAALVADPSSGPVQPAQSAAVPARTRPAQARRVLTVSPPEPPPVWSPVASSSWASSSRVPSWWPSG